MRTKYSRLFRKKRTPNHETSFFQKDSQSDKTFFSPYISKFFQPSQGIHRKCEKCEEEDKKVQRAEDKKEEDKKVMRSEEKKEEKKINRQPEKKEEKKPIQKKETGNNSIGIKNINTYVNSLNGKGESLSQSDNHFFSSKIGHDFSNVKIHNDREANDSAKETNAKAYTLGNNIVFKEGQFNTETSEGKKLLAHELVHVIQQSNNAGKKIDRKAEFKKKEPAENINLAERFVQAFEKAEGTSHFGRTLPTINGADLTASGISNPLKVPSEGDMKSQPAGDVTRCNVTKTPAIVTSYNMTVPTKEDKWKYATDMNRVKGAFGGKRCSTSQVMVILTGDPDSATVYTNVKAHEGKHADQIEETHKTVIEPFDKSLENISMNAKDEKACKKNVLTMANRKAKDAWQKFVDKFSSLSDAFHSRPEGKQGTMAITDKDSDCQWLKVKGKA